MPKFFERLDDLAGIAKSETARVWLERVGVRTVSRSVIDVSADGSIDFQYEPLDRSGAA